MNTESKLLGSLYLGHSYHIKKAGVNNVPHGFGWYPLIWSLINSALGLRQTLQKCSKEGSYSL